LKPVTTNSSLRAGQAVRRSQLAQSSVDLAELDKVRAEHVPGLALLRHGPGLDRALDCLFADGLRLGPAAEPHEGAPERPDHAGTLSRRRVGRNETDSFAVLLEGGVAFAPRPHQVSEARVEEPGERRFDELVGQ
jgi:hypothetical protein